MMSSIGLVAFVKNIIQYTDKTSTWVILAESSRVKLDLWNLSIVIVLLS